MRALNVTETAVELRVCPETVYKLIREKKLGHRRIGNRIIITDEDIQDFLKESRVGEKTEISG